MRGKGIRNPFRPARLNRIPHIWKGYQMSDIKIEITASTVAWYGAITATAALGIELVKLWLERRRVKLEILPQMRFFGGTFMHYSADTDFVIFKVINKGKRPVTINQHGVKLKGSNKYLVALPAGTGPGSLPKEILDGQDYSLYVLFDELRRDAGGFEGVEFFYVFDATGKIHKRKMNRKLLKDFQNRTERTERSI